MKSRRLFLVLVVLVLAGGAAWYVLWQRPREQRRIAFLHAARGEEEAERGNTPAALSEYQTAVRLDPSNPHAWYLLGSTQRLQGQDGLPALEKAAKLGPLDASFQREYGSALLDAGRPEEARKYLAEAVRLAPAEVPPHALLARAYLRKITAPDDLKKGIDELKTVLGLQPGDVDARFRLGRALFQSDRLDDARAEFTQCIQLLKEGASSSNERMDGRSQSSVVWFGLVKGCHHYLSQIAGRQGKKDEAERHLALFNRMEAYARDTDRPFAKLRKDPKDAEALASLKGIFARYGFPPEGPDGPKAAAAWIPK